MQKRINKETLGGIALISAAVVALIWANSPLASAYEAMIHLEWIKGIAIFAFFFSIGIELRHEIQHGSLRSARSAIVPIFAAIGGMTVPVLIYSAFNAGLPTSAGWGVPMSTDVAFALAVFAIAGSFLPKAIRTFVLTVAVVDDSLTILMIALFFASSFHMLSLVSLAGVVLGIFMPKGEKILPKLQPSVAFIALPIFALFSAGVNLANINFDDFSTSAITIGILVAMIVGKPLGVLGTTFLVTKTGLGKLPEQIKWADLLPTGLLFGMCFTVALLMSELSFGESIVEHSTANLSVFIGSTVAALLATLALTFRKRAHAKH
ncbi:Na+/H+ antiporter NhaA [Rhodoluna sp.]|uniref:Na+/H+ antiporter NhaA n=1 Tax=Rhodoluna sp. TaxID=1969481 RepID=UPI0025E86BD6|nr:Na+/H+ antiporter NhaA [Rhodoluna sp.]